MVADKKIFFYAGIITLALFVSIYSLNAFMNLQREKVVVDRMEVILEEYQEIQTLSIVSGIFGDEITCLSLENTLSHLDKTLWDTGVKIDQYREATENFGKDPFYLKQKKNFNRNEVIYFSMVHSMRDVCNLNQTVMLYFYKKKEDCLDCDAQAFVLSDINKELGPEIAIFSFDSDLELPSVKTLELFYNITDYPCMVIDDEVHCGLYDKDRLSEVLCENNSLSICK